MVGLSGNLSKFVALGMLFAIHVSPPPILAASLNAVQVIDDTGPYGSFAVSTDGAQVYVPANFFCSCSIAILRPAR